MFGVWECDFIGFISILLNYYHIITIYFFYIMKLFQGLGTLGL